jgi:hypothetical protein
VIAKVLKMGGCTTTNEMGEVTSEFLWVDSHLHLPANSKYFTTFAGSMMDCYWLNIVVADLEFGYRYTFLS